MHSQKKNRANILGKIKDALVSSGRKDISAQELIALRKLQSKNDFNEASIPCPNLSEDIVSLFKTNLEKAASMVHTAQNEQEATHVISTYLEENNLTQELVCGDNPELTSLTNKLKDTNISIITGSTDGSHLVGLSSADAGIAETGTLALTSGTNNPTRINYLVDHHIIIIKRKRIVGLMEEAWRQIYQEDKNAKRQIPRATNFISGPSRTADIEQTIQLGAHGPRALLVIILD